MIEIKMPRLSDTMEEGAIATWHKKPGDAVAVGDVLVEIETDKAVMEYEAYQAGTLAEILVPKAETPTSAPPSPCSTTVPEVPRRPPPPRRPSPGTRTGAGLSDPARRSADPGAAGARRARRPAATPAQGATALPAGRADSRSRRRRRPSNGTTARSPRPWYASWPRSTTWTCRTSRGLAWRTVSSAPTSPACEPPARPGGAAGAPGTAGTAPASPATAAPATAAPATAAPPLPVRRQFRLGPGCRGDLGPGRGAPRPGVAGDDADRARAVSGRRRGARHA